MLQQKYWQTKCLKQLCNFYNTGNEVYHNEMDELMDEREKLYSGDTAIMDKIINIYGEELKNEWSNGFNRTI